MGQCFSTANSPIRKRRKRHVTLKYIDTARRTSCYRQPTPYPARKTERATDQAYTETPQTAFTAQSLAPKVVFVQPIHRPKPVSMARIRRCDNRDNVLQHAVNEQNELRGAEKR